MTRHTIKTSQLDFGGGYVVWLAWLDDMDDSPQGDGPTEADAIADLEWMIAEMEAKK